jgi:type IV fimbrial biogenesis protein FimT
MGLLRYGDYPEDAGQAGRKGFSLAEHGFTLLETLVVITVLGVLLTIAAPSFNEMLYQNRLQAGVNQIAADVAYARSEAIRRGVNVVVCFSTDQSSCANRSTVGVGWKDYRLIFTDQDADTYYSSSTESLLRVGEKIKGGGGYDSFGYVTTCAYFGFYPTGESLNPCYLKLGEQNTSNTYYRASQWTITVNRAGRISTKKTDKLYE